MNRAMTIQMFLPDGNPKGVKISEITNRTIQAIYIPRSELENAYDRSELSRVGIYFLFGVDDSTEELLCYIGEAEDCKTRIGQQNREKDFWQYVIVVVVNNEEHQFTKADVKYLENLSHTIAKKVNRYKLDQSIPTKSFVQEWRKADLHDIFETIKILVTSLGFPIFESLEKEKLSDKNNQQPIIEDKELFYCRGREFSATGYLDEEGFVVLKGSQFVKEPTISFRQSQISKMENFIQEEYFSDQGAFYVLVKNLLFSSPSMAASFVKQSSINGWIDWVNEAGKTLDEVYR